VRLRCQVLDDATGLLIDWFQMPHDNSFTPRQP
jgi:hypothetical protein